MDLLWIFQKKEKASNTSNLRFNEIWNSWTQKQNGFIQEEYNKDLVWLQGVQKYEEMRSSDATINATLLALELPLRATKWYFEAWKTNGETTEQDIEIKEFVEKALFEKLENWSFDDFLRQALTMFPFGFSVFEKVYKIEDGQIYLKKLAQRLQKSIYNWETQDKQEGITQQLFWTDAKTTMVSIPREKLVIFSFRKEGDNYEGRSVLRSAYKSWYLKDQLYKFEAVKFEKLSNWIPIITLPKGAGQKDKDEAEDILQNLAATEQTYIVLPNPDWKFEFADLKAWTTSDPKEAINHHNREITKNILAQFLELGATWGGSYALSEDQSSLFLLGLAAAANQFCEVVYQDILKELVDLNFSLIPGQSYPYLKYSKLGDVKYAELATTISTLVWVWVVNPDENLEKHMREVLDLPEKEEVETPEEQLTPDEEMDAETTIADLEAQIAALEANENESLVNSFIFADISPEEALQFRFLTQQQKDKISQGLIEFWKKKGKKSTQEVSQNKTTAETNKQAAWDKIKQTNEVYKQKISSIQTQIKALKGWKATKSQISDLKTQIEALKQEKNVKTSELKSIKELENKTIQEARKELKARKSALKEFITKLNEKVSQDLISEDEAKANVETQIKTNLQDIKGLSDSIWNEIKALREKISGLTRSSSEYKQIRKQIEEKTLVKNESIKTIRDENSTLRDNKSKIVANKKEIRQNKTDLIKTAKNQFSENEILKFSEESKIELELAKRILNQIWELQEENKIEPEDLGWALERIERELKEKVSIAELMKKVSDEDIKKVLYDIIRRKTPQNESLELQNYGFADKEELEDFKTSRKIFNFLDILNVQNHDK